MRLPVDVRQSLREAAAARARWRRKLRLLLLAALLAAGCGAAQDQDAEESGSVMMTASYDDDLSCFLKAPAGSHAWRWQWRSAGAPLRSGAASLAIDGALATWRLDAESPQAGPPDPTRLWSGRDTLLLTPCDPAAWHALAVPLPAPTGGDWLPLPRQLAASAYYADRLDLLQRLTRSRFPAGVRHWPARTVPVAADTLRLGDLDVAACLREAVDRWNAGEAEPFFSWDPASAWGVRLARADDPTLPPLAARFRAADSAGRPTRIEILVGESWRRLSQRPYLVRGLVHELGHALLLWGHSEDRAHVLWRCGPLRDTPSLDERAAARLWSLLPEGLDLRRYDRSTEIEAPR